MNVVIWTILSSFGCVFQCKAGNVRHTNCTNMRWLKPPDKKLHLECRGDEVLYVTRQDMRHTNGTVTLYTNDIRLCEKIEGGSSKECFRSVPNGFGTDFISYFNTSQKCNRENTCKLGYNDFYSSTVKFTTNCSLGGTRFYEVRIVVYYECFLAESNILVGENNTVKNAPDRSLYIMATKGNACRINGGIESGRILEQANMNLTIRQGNNRICSETLGVFHYNTDLSCIRGLSGIIFDFEISNAAAASTKRLWIEIKGSSLQLVCGDITEALLEQPPESFPVLLIAGPVAGVLLLLGVIVLVVILKRRNSQMLLKNTPKCADVTTTFRPSQTQGGTNPNDVVKPQNEKDHSVSSTKITDYNRDIPECPLQIEDGNYSLITPQFEETVVGEKQANCHKIDDVGDGVYDSMDEPLQENPTTPSLATPRAGSLHKESETVTTSGEPIIGEVTGDVYASVCKVEKVESNRITGPKGDVYATVSTTSSRE